MSYRSNHQGGLERAARIRCGACRAVTPWAALESGAFTQAAELGWDTSRPVEPRCPECRNSLLATG